MLSSVHGTLKYKKTRTAFVTLNGQEVCFWSVEEQIIYLTVMKSFMYSPILIFRPVTTDALPLLDL